MVSMKFIAFLKGTLGQMVHTKVIDVKLDFWESWPRKFYNIRYYDTTKEEDIDAGYAMEDSRENAAESTDAVMEYESQESQSILAVEVTIFNYITVDIFFFFLILF